MPEVKASYFILFSGSDRCINYGKLISNTHRCLPYFWHEVKRRYITQVKEMKQNGENTFC